LPLFETHLPMNVHWCTACLTLSMFTLLPYPWNHIKLIVISSRSAQSWSTGRHDAKGNGMGDAGTSAAGIFTGNDETPRLNSRIQHYAVTGLYGAPSLNKERATSDPSLLTILRPSPGSCFAITHHLLSTAETTGVLCPSIRVWVFQRLLCWSRTVLSDSRPVTENESEQKWARIFLVLSQWEIFCSADIWIIWKNLRWIITKTLMND